VFIVAPVLSARLRSASLQRTELRAAGAETPVRFIPLLSPLDNNHISETQRRYCAAMRFANWRI
jgi:hypothetical protein